MLKQCSNLLLPPFVCNILFCILPILLVLPDTLCSQTLISARLTTIPSATHSAGLSESIFSDNPALFSRTDSNFIALSLVPARFGVKELSSSALLGGTRISQTLSGGISLSGLGNSLYNEMTGSAFVALRASASLSVGAGCEFTRLGISGAEPLSALQAHIGSTLRLSQFFSAGFALRNINRAQFSNGNSAEQEALLSLGISTEEGIDADAGVRIVLNQSSAFSLALAYSPLSAVRIRLATLSSPQTLEMGFRYTFSPLALGFSAQYHEILGFSQECSLIYWW